MTYSLSNVLQVCEEHDGQPVAMFCMTCKITLCNKCMFPLPKSAHKMHDVQDLDEVKLMVRVRLIDCGIQIETLKEQHEAAVKGVKNELMRELEEQKEQCLQKVEEACDQVKRDIQIHHDKAVKDLIHERTTTSIASVEAFLETDACEALKVIEDIQNLIGEMHFYPDSNEKCQKFEEAGKGTMRVKFQKIFAVLDDEDDSKAELYSGMLKSFLKLMINIIQEDAGLKAVENSNILELSMHCISCSLAGDHNPDTELLDVSWALISNLCNASAVYAEEMTCQRALDVLLKTYSKVKYMDQGDHLINPLLMLSNVAAYSQLRTKLYTEDVLRIMLQIMGIYTGELKDIACSVLVYLVSDSYNPWADDKYSRESVLAEIAEAVASFEFYEGTIRYENLGNEITLLSRYDVPELQHWALWTICNLLLQDKDHYKSLLDKGGMGAITDVINHTDTTQEMEDLALKVLSLCE